MENNEINDADEVRVGATHAEAEQPEPANGATGAGDAPEAESGSSPDGMPSLSLWEMFEKGAATRREEIDDATSRVLTRSRSSVWDLGRSPL